MSKHPMQPVEFDKEGTARFKQNAIVRYLLDNGPFDMNALAFHGFDEDDQSQFAQLIGYSVSGYGELEYANLDHYDTALINAEQMKCPMCGGPRKEDRK